MWRYLKQQVSLFNADRIQLSILWRRMLKPKKRQEPLPESPLLDIIDELEENQKGLNRGVKKLLRDSWRRKN